jgi:uncharacterized protein (TIGR01777 family)
MNVVIAGGTGFLGRALTAALVADRHQVLILSRRPAAVRTGSGVTATTWDPERHAGDLVRVVQRADAVVNLAGESIDGRRWNDAYKERIRQSRLSATTRLVEAIRQTSPAPALISASAIGYYGDRGDATLTETSPPGSDFLARVCVEWEKAALAAAPHARVALVRTGIVLDKSNGALPRMLLPFKLFAGGPLGSGRQYMSWIHVADWVALARWLVTTTSLTGPFNATAPNPVTNREFATALGTALHRPSFMPAPAFAIKLAVGEMAGPLVLGSERVIPARALEAGFSFKYPELGQALHALSL